MSLLDQVDQPAKKLPVDQTRIVAAIEKIRAAGFGIELLPGDKLLVTPRSKLTEAQVAWITKNKAAILAYLRSLPDAHVQALKEHFNATVESIALPAAPVEAVEPVLPIRRAVGVRCLDCRHGQLALPGDELGAWRLCEAGLGGYFALARRNCEGFAERASELARKAA